MTTTRQNLVTLYQALWADLDFPRDPYNGLIESTIVGRGIQTFSLRLQAIKTAFLKKIEFQSADFGYGAFETLFQDYATRICLDPASPEMVLLFKRCYQALNFLSKAKDVDTKVTAELVDFAEYSSKDLDLPATVLEFVTEFERTHDVQLLDVLRDNLSRLIGPTRPSNTGQFGPGSVNDAQFSRKFVTPLYSNGSDEVRYSGIYGEDHFMASLDRFPARDHLDFFKVRKNQSEFLLVPKDIRGPRTICRESSANSIHQQALRKSQQNAIHLNSGGFVNFADQSYNKLLALASSKNRSYSTIDLKDASDRVSLACVESVFPDDFIHHAKESRSEEVFFETRGLRMTHTLRKWAPMGSAICFTTLSALVYASCKAVAPSADIFVYGDDLVIPSECVDECVAMLNAIGLLVNKDKSYKHSFFRESCGMDAYYGVDCTAVKLRFLPSASSFQDVSLASLCSTAHQLFDAGLSQTCIALQDMILGSIPKGTDVPQGRVTDPFLTVPLSYAPNRKETWKVDPSLQLRYKTLRLIYLVDKTTKTYESESLYYYRAVSRSLVCTDEVLESRFDKRVSKRDLALQFRTSRVVLDGADGVRLIN